MQWVVRSSVLMFWHIKYWKMYTYSEHIKFEATSYTTKLNKLNKLVNGAVSVHRSH